jgi:Mn-dependent DtxR family transcriptional regulator
MPVKLTCPDCGKVCVGQTTKKFEEHFLCIRKKSTTKIAQHLIEHGHSFDTMESIMKILHFNKKGAHLDTIKKLHIYKEIMKNRPLNGTFTI